jgi:hypothetical protein
VILLRRIILVNWYAFAAQEVEVRGDVAFVGDNGAGKSSILDAVQLALTGGDRRYFSPNARAEDGRSQGRRTVRDYCIGRLGGPDEEPLRQGGMTYVVLVVSDDAGGRLHSFGVGLYADEAKPEEELEALFVVPGVELRASDLHVAGRLEGAASPWPELRPRLEAMARSAGQTLQTYRDQPGQYVKGLLVHLRGRHGAANPEHWLRALRLAVRFRGVENPDDFVRNYVLPEDPLDLRGLREDMRRYRDVVERIRALEVKERELTSVADRLDAHLRQRSVARVARLLGALAEREAARVRVRSSQETITDREVELKSCEAELRQLELDMGEAQAEREDARRALDADPSRARLAEAKAVHADARRLLAEARAPLDAQREKLRVVVEALRVEAATRSIAGANTLRASFQTAVVGDLASAWPGDGDAVRRALGERGAIGEACRTMRIQAEAAARAVVDAKTRLEEIEGRLADARRGGFRLRRETRDLVEVLSAEGMTPQPLCAVVEVTDPSWAQAVETVLGAGREAVLVDAAHVQAAVRRVRRERARFYDCIVVQAALVDRFGGAPERGSLAEVVRTSDRRARAFLNQRLGAFRRVETEADLEAAGRAVTRDCQVASAGGIQNRRPTDQLVLGRRYTEDDVRQLAAEHDVAMDALRVAETTAGNLARAATKLELAAEALPAPDDFEAALGSFKAADAALNAAQAEVERMSAEVPAELAERLKHADDRVAQVDQSRRKASGRRDLVRDGLSRAKADLEGAEREARRADETLTALPAEMDEMAAAEAELTERRGRRAGFTSLIDEARGRAANADREAEAQWRAGFNALVAYWHKHGEAPRRDGAPDPSSLGEVEGAVRWVRERLDRLRGHELREHKDAAVSAAEKVSQGLRQDLFVNLAARVAGAKRLLNDLNRHLRARPFKDEIYAFRPTEKPELADVLTAAEAVRLNPEAAEGPLDADDMDDPVARGKRRVLALLEGDGAGIEDDIRALSDYRGYFTYDLEMRHRETGRVLGYLSQRLRTGSGGEREAPSYVAVGTALAAANNIQPGTSREDIGFAPAVFDEAFAKLDEANIGTVLDLMGTLGLQMLAAGPTGKRYSFASRFETIVEVVRLGRTVHLVTHHGSEEYRRMLKADNPFEQTLEDWDRARQARADA